MQASSSKKTVRFGKNFQTSDASQENSELLALTTTDGKTFSLDMAEIAASLRSPERRLELYDRIPENLTSSSRRTISEFFKEGLVELFEEHPWLAEQVMMLTGNLSSDEEEKSETEVVTVKSKSAKKREQKKRREERRRNEEADGAQKPSSSEKSIGETGESEERRRNGAELTLTVDEVKARISCSDQEAQEIVDYMMVKGPAVRQALMASTNINWDILKEEMVENDTELMGLLKVWMTQKKMPPKYGHVRDAFMKAIHKIHSKYTIKEGTVYYRNDLLHSTMPVYVAFQMAKDTATKVCEEDLDDESEPSAFSLQEIMDFEKFISLVARYPLETLDALKEMIGEEEVNELEDLVSSREYKEYQKQAESHLEDIRNLQKDVNVRDEKWNLLKPAMKEAVYFKHVEVYHTFSVLLKHGKVRYLKSAESKEPFKIKTLPNSFELGWLLEEDPMPIYRYLRKWVKQKLIDHDYSNEDRFYQMEADVCKNWLMECLEYSDENMEWGDYGEEGQETIRAFVSRTHAFIMLFVVEEYHFDLEDVELDEVENQETHDEPKTSRQDCSSKSGDARKSTSCDNEDYLELKKKYQQEQNNRTIAEGELKRNQWKMDEWEKLKKEEEKWKQDKKTMAKKIRELEKQNNSLTNQTDEYKKLREKVEEQEREIRRLATENQKIEEAHEKLKTDFNKIYDQNNGYTNSLRKITESMSVILSESQRCPSENLNPSVEEKLEWHNELKKYFVKKEVVDRVRHLTDVLYKKTPEFVALMEKEQERLEEKADLYLKIVDFNLRLLKDTDSTSGLLPVPKVPGVSAGFHKRCREELDKMIKKKSCPICFEAILEGAGIYVCTNFEGHVMCFKCGERWKSKNNVGRVMCTVRCGVEMVCGTWRRPEE